MAVLSEKDIHCIARHMQEEYAYDEHYNACWYCKFAIECADNSKKCWETGRIAYSYYHKNAVPALEEASGVKVLHLRNKRIDYLIGSWLEEYPELADAVTKASVEVLRDIFRNPDILDYAHNPTTDKLKMLLQSQQADICRNIP